MSEGREIVVQREVGLMRPIASPQDVIVAHKEAVALIDSCLEEGTDYGVIPGTKVPTLLKPGAERLCSAFGVVARYEVVESEADHDRENRYKEGWVQAEDPGKEEKQRLKDLGLGRNRQVNGEWQWQEKGDGESVSLGLYRYVIRCQLFSRRDDSIIAEGIGSCSTLESKYISRPRDCENTVLKMAEKRAHVAAVLNAFGLSDRFTQDVEPEERPNPKAKNAAGTANAPGSTTATPPRTETRQPEELTLTQKVIAHKLKKEEATELKLILKLATDNSGFQTWLAEAYDAGAIGFAALLPRANSQASAPMVPAGEYDPNADTEEAQTVEGVLVTA